MLKWIIIKYIQPTQLKESKMATFNRRMFVEHVLENKSVWKKMYKKTKEDEECVSLVQLGNTLTQEDLKYLLFYGFFSKERFIQETKKEVHQEMFWNGGDMDKALCRVAVNYFNHLFPLYMNFGVPIMEATKWIAEFVSETDFENPYFGSTFTHPWHYECMFELHKDTDPQIICEKFQICETTNNNNNN